MPEQGGLQECWRNAGALAHLDLSFNHTCYIILLIASDIQ
jgi:hypothetical protein